MLFTGVTFYSKHTQNAASFVGSKVSAGEILSDSVQISSPRNLPKRLLIPKIHVDANIQSVGLTASGSMDVPTNSVDAGWFKEGTAPGETGSAVIDGHLDAKDGSSGIFQNLGSLNVGDTIRILDSTGAVLSFVVWQKQEYDWDARPPEVFSKNDGKYLNLITCTGVWNVGKQSYSKRLVVFTSIEK